MTKAVIILLVICSIFLGGCCSPIDYKKMIAKRFPNSIIKHTTIPSQCIVKDQYGTIWEVRLQRDPQPISYEKILIASPITSIINLER